MHNSGEDGLRADGKYTRAMSNLQSSLWWSFLVISQAVLKIVFYDLSRVKFKFFLCIILFELYSHTLSHLRINIVYDFRLRICF